MLRDKIRFLLKDVTDLERLIGRLNLGTATPRDLLALNRSIRTLPAVRLYVFRTPLLCCCRY